MPKLSEMLNLKTSETETLGVQNIALMLTYQCQMACRYCFLDRRHPDMTEDVLRKSIDLLLTTPKEEAELQFFGGEPLLRFDLIKKAIAYAEKKSREHKKKVRYLLTTNGLLLDREKIAYLRKYPVSFLVSLDGNVATQASNRPIPGANNKYLLELVLKNIRFLNKIKANYFINVVICPENVKFFKKNFVFFVKNKIKKIHFSYQLGIDWNETNMSDYFFAFFNTLELLKLKQKIDICNFRTSDEPFLISPALTVDFDGKIYCHCTIPLEKILPDLRKINLVGNVVFNKNFENIKQSKLNTVRKIIYFYSRNPGRKKIIISNLMMGELSDIFFKEFLKNGSFES